MTSIRKTIIIAFGDPSNVSVITANILLGYGGNLKTLTGQPAGSVVWPTLKLLGRNLMLWSGRRTTFSYIERNHWTFELDLKALFELVGEGKMEVLVKKVWALEDVRQAHLGFNSAEGIGSCLIKVGDDIFAQSLSSPVTPSSVVRPSGFAFQAGDSLLNLPILRIFKPDIITRFFGQVQCPSKNHRPLQPAHTFISPPVARTPFPPPPQPDSSFLFPPSSLPMPLHRHRAQTPVPLTRRTKDSGIAFPS
ncbi:MAG: hypothetical protein Q9210_002115 [Variospora velana]